MQQFYHVSDNDYRGGGAGDEADEQDQ